MEKNTNAVVNARELGLAKMSTLGLQHAFTMFGATVLVPIITGLDVSVSLLLAGIGTLIFHLITKGKVPAFLGSSFAFIAPILAVAESHGLAYARGGIVVAGLIYLILAGLMQIFGTEKVIKFFPPVVTGPIIIVIGLKLAPVAVGMASENWALALIAFAVVTAISVFAKGFLKVIPVIVGLIVTYIVAVIFGQVDFTAVKDAAWIGLPAIELAKFDLGAILTVAPIALATMVEHVGDVIAIGATVDKNFMEDPGLTRTLTGDGVATAISAMFGGPANTTYSENTGVLALTRVWDPVVMRIAAVFAILLGFIPKLGAIISSIPGPIIGGISIILFGMIASIGARTLVENKVDFNKSRNLIITATIVVLGLGGAVFPIEIGEFFVQIEGMALAAIAGIILNVVLPE
ncbi:uracil permease [Acidaminobacter sp. JC074]|uniref:uracil-xanthine permease family protein n=1 Tax=Acidaminobacter sp. JC074 TaxID=2530199 RepID=UPI001F104A0D|nr:solute carrier family 23 protein [Acidaminobacter sp. JC074]MCH4887793.1 uracil permease [Acidaminobacter sp. JC074]